MILDCCQKFHDRGESENLTIADQNVIENAARDIVLNRKEQMPDVSSNVAILNSCKEGQSAYEWDSRKHGIFTAHLLDAFNHRYDSVAQIVGYISKNVEKTAMELGKTQTPFYKLEGNIQLPVDEKTTPLETGDVFISYRHCNADLVAPVEEELKKRGISYFIDRVGVNYGIDYSTAIARAVKACKVMLFFWTQDANDSGDMIREVKMALDLNKRVVPYRIGDFNPIEHDALYYQLSTLSRYDASQQTQRTIVELVNRVQQALTNKTYQQYSFVLPEKSQDAVIQKPVINDIEISIAPRVIEQQQTAIQYKEITLPPLSDELLKIQAESQGLQEAIEQLRAYTHESLSQANAAVEQAEAQLDAWKERRDRLWKDLPQATQQKLERVISNNPECTEKDVNAPVDDMSYDKYFDFLEQFQCGKKYEQAKRELERVKQERKIKCSEAIQKCQQKINNFHYNECVFAFLDKVIMTILPVMPGYDDINAPFPESLLLDPLRQLSKYKLSWRPDQIFNRTRELWAENRPCIIAKREEEERKRREEEERDRKQREEEERKRREEEEKERKQREEEERKRREEEERELRQREEEERKRREEEERELRQREVAQIRKERREAMMGVLRVVGVIALFPVVGYLTWLYSYYLVTCDIPYINLNLSPKVVLWIRGIVTFLGVSILWGGLLMIYESCSNNFSVYETMGFFSNTCEVLFLTFILLSLLVLIVYLEIGFYKITGWYSLLSLPVLIGLLYGIIKVIDDTIYPAIIFIVVLTLFDSWSWYMGYIGNNLVLIPCMIGTISLGVVIVLKEYYW